LRRLFSYTRNASEPSAVRGTAGSAQHDGGARPRPDAAPACFRAHWRLPRFAAGARSTL